MSDRGRNRRPARSTKATPPKATPVEPDASTDVAAGESAEIDESPVEVPAGEAVADDAAAEDPAGEDPAGEDPAGEDSAGEEAADEASADEPDDTEPADKPDKTDKGKGKAPAPLTKAEKRAAARVAARKAARRRRIIQGIAGTVIVLLAVGGAFAGVWYFGNRAEEKKAECKKTAESTYPPMLGGFDKRLATEPKVEPGKEDKVGLRNVTTLIQGKCKTVKPGDTVVVNYVGATYKDAKVFDSSWQRKQTFPVQVGMLEQGQQPQVIEGWDRGLVGTKVGSRIILDIPAKEAYGDTPSQPGAPVGDLRFVVDILDIQAPGATAPGLGGN